MPPNATRSADPDDASGSRPDPGSRGPDPLERLRDRVERAATEIERLREENALLADRLRAVAEAGPEGEGQPPQALPAIGGDPEATREKIQGFLDALDRLLAERTASPPDPHP
jgi:hypothetical protein